MVRVNKQPIYYLQTDPKWRNVPYAVTGEKSTIGGAGCGPTAAAMLIATLTKHKVTPIDTCAWALKKGYKALRQGTYYSYFVPQFKAYGLECIRLNSSRMLNVPNHKIHQDAKEYLKKGYYLIALMGPGNWTRSGHFVVVWEHEGVYYINDPASKATSRMKGDDYTFRNECRMYWAIKPPVEDKKEDEKMTGEVIYKRLMSYLNELPTSEYAMESSKKAVKSGLFADGKGDGLVDNPRGILTREQLAVVLNRAGLLD